MNTQRKAISLKHAGKSALEELDALNMETRREIGVVPMIESTIEATAKKRKRQEKPLSSARKQAR